MKIFTIFNGASSNKLLIMVLVLTGVLTFTGEVVIFYICSWWWQWPRLGVSTDSLNQLVKHNPSGLNQKQVLSSATLRHHYQSGDVHYYSSLFSPERATGKGGFINPAPAKSIQVLIMSDPHIMCTYDR